MTESKTYRYLLPLAASCFVMLWVGTAQAGRVEGLYRATVAVTSQETAEREAAVVDGFKRVLIKVTGESRLEERPETQSLLKQAPRFLQQYRYDERLQPAQLPGQDPVEVLELHLQFDTGAVNDALRRNRLPIWGALRPTVLVWLAVERGASRSLVGADSDPAFVSVVEEAARRRGLPILFPLLDLEDQAALSAADVWGNFRSTIERASARYQPDAILVGRVFRRRNGRWEAMWTLYHDDTVSPWLSGGALSSRVLTHGLDNAADLMAARFAPIGVGVTGNAFLLQVDGVESLETYARLTRYLSELQSIQSVRPARVNGPSTTFYVEVEGDYRLLRQVIGLSSVLLPVPDPLQPANEPVVASALPVLRYRVGP